MSPGILALVAVVALLTAVGVRELQDRLERGPPTAVSTNRASSWDAQSWRVRRDRRHQV